jgi:protease I
MVDDTTSVKKIAFLVAAEGIEHAGTRSVDQAVGDVGRRRLRRPRAAGGVANPDVLRTYRAAVAFVRESVGVRQARRRHLPRPWTLVEPGGMPGRQLTSWPSLQADLRNAGATWVDRKVVDGNLITSRNPDDVPAFNNACSRPSTMA